MNEHIFGVVDKNNLEVAKEPIRSTAGSLGYDLRSNEKEPVVIPPWSERVIKTGYRLLLDEAALILPRSGLAAKLGVTVLNAPGLIDMDYQGQLMVILATRSATFTVNFNDRIAQLVFCSDFDWHSQESLTLSPCHAEYERTTNGLGSTGVK